MVGIKNEYKSCVNNSIAEEDMTKEVQIFDIDKEAVVSDGLAKVRWWIQNNQDKINTHNIVIKREIEGEVHFLQKDIFLTELHDSLRNWPAEQCFLVMADVNLESNIEQWFKGTAEKIAPIKGIAHPMSLLIRTRDFIQNKSIRQPKNVDEKTKKFICMNGAAKPHRAKLIDRLYADNYHDQGWITWVNRYGKLPKKYFTNSIWQGEDLLLDFNNETIDQGQNQELLPSQYHYAGFEIVTESIASDTSLFLTEKTWKPILYNKIFILLGTKDSYKFLIENGFEPYSELYDHSFDSDNFDLRFEKLYEQINNLMNYSPEEWTEIYQDKIIQEKIKHNSHTFKNLQVDNWLKQVNE